MAGLKFDNLKTTSLEEVKKIFQKKYNNCIVSKKYEVLEKIEDSINDLNNRYLLLITKSSISDYLINSIICNNNENKYIKNNNLKITNEIEKVIKEKIIFYIGSRFIQDQNSEEYTLKMINKIQIQMEKNVLLILKDLDSVYPSLYDLFNQNFTVVSEKNYARLSVGYSNNTFSLVNDKFKCIVIVNEEDISEQDPPFLNRFEKHIIDFEYLLDNKLVNLSEKIMNIKKNLQEIKLLNGKKLSYDISKLFINYNKEEIQGIIYYLSLKNKSEEDIENFIFKKISMVLPQDVILMMKFSENVNKFRNAHDKIIKYYNEHNHTNLISHLKNMEKNKNIIYTFSNILDPLFPNFDNNYIKDNNNNYIETLMFGKLKKENIKIILINSIISENDLENIFDNFYANKEEKVMIFKFSPDECEIINYLKNFIEEKEKDYKEENNKRGYIFIIYLKRMFNKSRTNIELINKYQLPETITLLDDNYYQIFIDNLNGIDININKLMDIKNIQDLVNTCLVDINTILFKNIYSIFSYFRYTFKFQLPDNNINKNNYSKHIVEYLSQNKYLKGKLLTELLNLNFNNEEDLIKEIFINDFIKPNNIDYISVISDYLLNNIIQNLAQFVFKSEIKHILSPFLSHINNIDTKKEKKSLLFENKYINETIDYAFQDINNDKEIKYINQIGCNNITILLGIKIPGIKTIIDNLISFINDNQIGDMKLSENYLSNENEIRLTSNDGDNDEYMKEIDSIKLKLKNDEFIFYEYLKSIPLFKKISLELENDESQKQGIEYLNLFFEDYLLIFLSNNFDLSNTEVYNKDLIYNFIKIIKDLLKRRFENYDEMIKAEEF